MIGRFRVLKVLQNPPIRKLWLSQVLSAVGDNFYDIAVVWIATRQVGAAAGGVVLAGSLSTLIFGIFGGILADRVDRRLGMAVVDGLRALVLLILILFASLDELRLWHLVIVTAINVGLNALFQPMLIASLPVISKDAEELQATNALMDVTARIARATAPMLAGFVLANLLPTHLFALDALTFFISMLAILSLSTSFHWKPKRDPAKPRAMRQELRDAYRLVTQHPYLRYLFFIVIPWTNIVWGLAYIIGIPLLAERVLQGDAQTFGAIVSAYGVGNILSNLVLGNLTITNRAQVMFWGVIVLGLGFLSLGLSQSLPIAMLSAFFAAMGGPMEDLMLLMMIQEDFPTDQIGKIYSLRLVISEIGYSIGVGSAALIYAILSVPMVIAICGMILVITAGLGYIRTTRRVVNSYSV